MILKQGEIFIDTVDYFINTPDKIMGVLAAMIKQEA